MKRIANLKKNIGKKINIVKIKVANASTSSPNEPLKENEEVIRNSLEINRLSDIQGLNYKEILQAIAYDVGFDEENFEAFNMVQKICNVSDNDYQSEMQKIKDKLCAFKLGNIIDHSMLLVEIVKQELDKERYKKYSWCRNLKSTSSIVINSHSKYKHLNIVESSLAEWLALIEIQEEYRVVYPKIFFDLVEVMSESRPQHDGLYLKIKNEEIENLFDNSIETFLNSLKKSVEILHSNHASKENTNILASYFQTARKLLRIKTQKPVVLAPDAFETMVKESIRIGITESFKNNGENYSLHTEASSENLFRITQFVVSSARKYQELLNDFEELFKSEFGFDYRTFVYKNVDENVADFIKSPIIVFCMSERSSNLFLQTSSEDEKLFDLYLALKQFSDAGMEIDSGSEFYCLEFFRWFDMNADHTNNCPIYSAYYRIQRALAFDDFKSNDGTSNNSSSAVDVIGIIDSVMKFWEAQRSTFLSKLTNKEYTNFVANEVCRFTIIYFNMALNQIDSLKSSKEDAVRYFEDVCAIVNNADFVFKKLQTMIVTFITAIEKGSLALPIAFKNTLKLGSEVRSRLIVKSMEKITPYLHKLIEQDANLDYNKSVTITTLQVNIDNVFKSHLSSSDCKTAKSEMHKVFIDILYNLVNANQQTITSSKCCSNLLKFLRNSEIVFNSGSSDYESLSKYLKTEKELEYLSLSTLNLIHQYYLDRYEDQTQTKITAKDPVLLVDAYFRENSLNLTIWNAKNLCAVQTNEFSKTYVKFSILPEEHFPLYQNLKTKICLSTEFVLYEESFEKELTTDQREIKDGIIHFSVKGRNILNNNSLIGEAFLHFKDIKNAPYHRDSKSQISLPLTLMKKSSEKMNTVEILEKRSKLADKTAFEFIIKLK